MNIFKNTLPNRKINCVERIPLNQTAEYFLKKTNIFEDNKYFNDIKNIVDKHQDLSFDDIPRLMKNYKIYCDYDEVLSNLITPWLEDINSKSSVQYLNEDVTHFNFFNDIEFGLDFLSKEDMYRNVLPTPEAILFLKKLKELDLLYNFYILTASPPEQALSKKRHMEKYFSEFFDYSKVIVTKSKFKMDFSNGVLIDDAIHNVESIVQKNPYGRAVILNYKHNQGIYTGDRINRVSSLMDFFELLPLLVVQSYDRFFSENKKYLQKELFFN